MTREVWTTICAKVSLACGEKLDELAAQTGKPKREIVEEAIDLVYRKYQGIPL